MAGRWLTRSQESSLTSWGKYPGARSAEELLRNGIILLDKQQGPTSHQVDSWIKRLTGVKKASHGGTLDPRVSGVLVIALAGGLAEIGQGQSVVIKPNCVWYTGAQTVPTHEPDAPITTDPEVLRAVIRAVKERNQAPERILVADHAGFLMSTTLVMKKRGLYDVALEEGVQVKGWEDTPHARFSSPRWEYLSQPVDVSETLLGCDHFINVPVLKNHSLPVIRDQAQYSCCLKAFVGTISASNRLFNRRMFHEWNLPEKVAELNLIRPWRMPDGRPGITMNVVDATRVIVSGGPHNSIFLEEMKVAEPGMILASRDRVACDTVALSVLKHHARLRQVDRDYTRIPVWQQRQIVHAARLGLGIADPARIDILTRGLPSALEQSILAIWSES